MIERADFERLERYLSGEGTDEERAAIHAWVHADAERVALVDAMRTIGHDSRTSPWNVEAALARAEHRIRGTPTRSLQLQSRTSTRRRRWWPFAAAACTVVAGGVLYGSFRSAPSEAGPAEREVTTTAGQRAQLNLSDGSKVVLAAQSRLRIPQGFGAPGHARELWLEGEAVFSVRHDANRPFVVHTPNGTTQDLGTEFVASAYPETDGTQVAVREGRVAILRLATDSLPRHEALDADTLAVLSAGDVALLTRSGILTVSRNTNVARHFAAADGVFLLDDIALRDAIPRIDRWYGVRVEVADKNMLRRKVSGEFRDESVVEVLNVLAIAVDGEVVWDQDRAILKRPSARVRSP